MRHAVSRLRPSDWLDTEGICSSTGVGAEGPAVFRYGGVAYIFASHLTGWAPNAPLLHRSAAGPLCGSFWLTLPQPSHGPQADICFNAQVPWDGGACVGSSWSSLQLTSTHTLPAPSCPTPAQSTFIYEHRFEDGEPLLLWMGDRWNSAAPGGVASAGYVWLPLLPHTNVGVTGGFELVWTEGWSLRQYKGARWDPVTRAVRFAQPAQPS